MGRLAGDTYVKKVAENAADKTFEYATRSDQDPQQRIDQAREEARVCLSCVLRVSLAPELTCTRFLLFRGCGQSTVVASDQREVSEQIQNIPTSN